MAKEVCPSERGELDITDRNAVARVIGEIKPDAVIHCAGWTAVDAAEDVDKQALVHRINVDGTQYNADACKNLNCKMLYLSIDYVFNGQGNEPWVPDCRSYGALNVYGQSKLGGELVVANTLNNYFIVRIAWVFGLNPFPTWQDALDRYLKELKQCL